MTQGSHCPNVIWQIVKKKLNCGSSLSASMVSNNAHLVSGVPVKLFWVTNVSTNQILSKQHTDKTRNT